MKVAEVELRQTVDRKKNKLRKCPKYRKAKKVLTKADLHQSHLHLEEPVVTTRIVLQVMLMTEMTEKKWDVLKKTLKLIL